MTTTIKEATEQREAGPVAMIEQYRGDISLVLPSHVKPATWVRVAMGAVRKSADLWKACNDSPSSMMVALMESARLGLEPGTDEYYLTPRRNKAGKWEVLGIVGYQGEIEMIYRAGAVSSVICEVVREGDEFTWVPGEMDRPVHKPKAGAHAWFSGRGEVLGCYAYAIMRDGGAVSKVVIVDDERIKRAISASGTANSSHSPWKTDYAAMVLKTGAHDLSKWVPTSAEYKREQLRAARDVASETPPPSTGGFVPPPADNPQAPAVIEGEVVDQEPPPIEQPPDERDPDTHPAEKSQKNKLFGLLRDGAVSGSDRALRLRIVGRILNRPPAEPVTSFDQLSACEVDQVNEFLQRRKDAGDLTHTLAELGTATPADTTEHPAGQPEQPTDTEGEQ